MLSTNASRDGRRAGEVTYDGWLTCNRGALEAGTERVAAEAGAPRPLAAAEADDEPFARNADPANTVALCEDAAATAPFVTRLVLLFSQGEDLGGAPPVGRKLGLRRASDRTSRARSKAPPSLNVGPDGKTSDITAESNSIRVLMTPSNFCVSRSFTSHCVCRFKDSAALVLSPAAMISVRFKAPAERGNAARSAESLFSIHLVISDFCISPAPLARSASTSSASRTAAELPSGELFCSASTAR